MNKLNEFWYYEINMSLCLVKWKTKKIIFRLNIQILKIPNPFYFMLNFRGCVKKYLYELYFCLCMYIDSTFTYFPKDFNCRCHCIMLSNIIMSKFRRFPASAFLNCRNFTTMAKEITFIFYPSYEWEFTFCFKIMQYKTFFAKLAACKPNQNKIQCSVIHKQITPMSWLLVVN